MRSWMAAASRLLSPTAEKTTKKLGARRALRSRIGLEPLEERAMLAVFHVALTGSDGNDGSAATPYRTIQQAITAASAADDGDDIIRVAGGEYGAAVDLGFTIHADAELDTLDIAGSYDALFITQDFVNTPTIYVPNGEGEHITVNDADVTIESMRFNGSSVNNGIVVAAGNFRLDTVWVSNAVDAMLGDTLSGPVNIENSRMFNLSGTGVKLTNMTGDLGIFSSTIELSGANGVDFEGSGGAFVSIQTSSITNHPNGVGARIANPGGQVSFGNNSVVSNNASGIVVEGASSLAIDATQVNLNTLNGLTASNVTGQVSLTGSTDMINNGFIGAHISNAGSLDINNVDVLDNSAGGLIASTVSGGVEITNSSFDNNSTGIGIDGAGFVTIENSSALSNTTANGLTINNGGTVSVTGQQFNGNAGNGIEITNSLGVTLDGLTANQNLGDGINLATVGAVILINVIADLNDPGLVIDNAPSVSDTDGSYSSNLGSGVVLTNIGAGGVQFTGTDANLNGGDGFFLSGNAGHTGLSGVTVDNNGGDGAHLESVTTVGVSSLHADGNDDDGLHVDTADYLSVTSAAITNNTAGAGLRASGIAGAVELAGDFDMNNVGILIDGAASVAAGLFSADGNNLNGLDISQITGLVEIFEGSASGNFFHGINVENAGALSVNLFDANNNSAAGLVASSISGSVSITSSDFNDNSSGIGVDGADKVEVDDVSASNNTTANGLVINNVTGAGTALIIGGSSFNGNAADGVRVTNVAAQLTLDEVEASGNGEEGFDIDGGEELELFDLTLKNNASGVGGKVVNVGQIRFTGTDIGVVADLIEVTGSSITHTRAGDAQQVITYTDDTSRLSVSGKDGDDTIRLSGTFTLGAGDGLTVFAGDDNDLIESNGVQGFGQTVPLILNGESGTDSLTVNSLSASDDFVELVSGFVNVKYGPNAQAATPEVHEFDQIEEVTITTAGGNDSVVVTEPVSGAFPDFVSINGGDENDGIELNLGKPDTEINYNINGAAGNNGLTIFTRSANDNVLTFTDFKVEVEPRTPPDLAVVKTIEYVNIRGINAFADAGNDAFHVDSNFNVDLERISLFGQGDQDLVEIFLDSPFHAALFQFDGGTGTDNRLSVFTDNAGTDSVTINSQLVRTIPGSSTFPPKDVEYTNVQSLQVDTAGGADEISLSQAVAAPNLPASVQVNSDEDADIIAVDPANIPNSVELLFNLGSGDDTVTVTLPTTAVQTTMYMDGAGNDVGDLVRVVGQADVSNNISVGELSSNVDRLRLLDIELLFMFGGSAADVFSNNSSANSLIDGLGGNDSLTGGSGRDFILGEGGLDELSTLGEEDLLVSGPVTFDLHIASLIAIMSEWTSSRTFEERIANINGTGIGPRNNGDAFLQPTVTVFDEGALDLLTGGTEDDWFLAQTSNDQVLDQQNLDDVVTVIP